MNLKKFFAELKRRNVYRTAVAYGVVAWFLTQLTTQVFPFFDIPNASIRLVVVVLALGFPIAMCLSWLYEFTPEGIVRSEDLTPAEVRSSRRATGRILDFIIIGVLLTVIAFMAWQHWRPAKTASGTAPPSNSIAVLPFVDMSPLKNQEYLSDGVTEQIIDSLAHLHGLFVIARTTAFSFKNKTGDIREMGRQLQVSHVLEGSVRRENGKVRVAAQLINVATGFHLWSESYDSTEQDLLSLQSDVARKVAAALRIELHLAETKQLARPPTQNPEAYDSYLRGRYLLEKRTVDSIQKGRALFEEAVLKDPRFAQGHAGIADSYILLAKLGAISAREAATHAWTGVTAALAIDDNLAEAYVSRATILTDFEWNWAQAEPDYRKAIELSPNSASAHHWYARHLAEIGRFEEAMKEIQTAEKLDALSPFIGTEKAKILYMAHRYDEAIAQCHRALDLEGNFTRSFSILGQALLQARKYPEGIEAVKKFVELSNNSGFAKLELAYAYAVAGNKPESDRIMNEVTTGSGPFSPYDMATICAVWHDNAGAFGWLGKAIEQRSVDVIWIRVDPRLDPLRPEPGFKEIVARIAPK